MERKIETVQIDGLVLMKIIKHCEDEIVQTQDVATGVLLGLSSNEVLEVTHCFPSLIPEEGENDTNTNENSFISVYPTKMIRQLRDSNVDYMEIGFYQSSSSGAFLNRISLENLYNYHCNLNESVMLIYDPSKANRGQISLRAFQLTPELKAILSECNFDSNDSKMDPIKLAKINSRNMWHEIPVIVRNSHLVNCLVGTINEQLSTNDSNFRSLDLGVGNDMESHIKAMTESIDTLCQHLQTHLAYKKMINRGSKNNQPLPTLPDKLETSLLTAEINEYCQDLSEISGQTFSKLLLVKGVQGILDIEE